MERVKEIAHILNITEDEAREVLKADKEIDRGAKLFELTDEQKKAEKKYKNVGTRTVIDAYGKKRERIRKPHEEKREAIQTIANAFISNGNMVEILNEERELMIQYGAKRFKVTLSEPRK